MRYIYVLNIIAVVLYSIGIFKIVPGFKDKSKIKTKPKYKKLIFLLLDGLRIDACLETNNQSFYHNKMPKFYKIKKHLFLSVSGIPTTTSTRVSSIATGKPSNFVDILMTFKHSKENIENLPEIAKRKGTFIFLGDSVWQEKFLLDNSFLIRSYENSHDFSEEKVIIEKLKKSVGKYDTIISHLLFLDHYGHMYTIHNEKISMVLKAYDDLIDDIYKKMDDETLFVILSDHGVNEEGNHGGTSVRELSAMCAFIAKDLKSNTKNIKDFIKRREKFLNKSGCLDTGWINTDKKINIIHQMDILPTICYFMGWEIPFNNCGNYIHEIVEDGYEKLFLQKLKLLEKQDKGIAIGIKKYLKVLNRYKDKLEKGKNNLNIYLNLNYYISELIINNFSVYKHFYLFLGGILMIISIFLQRRYFSKQMIYPILVCLFAATSVYSHIHEDILWLSVIIFEFLDLFGLLVASLIFNTGIFPLHEFDRFLFKEKSLLVHIFCSILFIILKRDKRMMARYKNNFRKNNIIRLLKGIISGDFRKQNILSNFREKVRKNINFCKKTRKREIMNIFSYLKEKSIILIRNILISIQENTNIFIDCLISYFTKLHTPNFALPYLILTNSIAPFIFPFSTVVFLNVFINRKSYTFNFALSNLVIFILGLNYSFSSLKPHLIFKLSEKIPSIFLLYFIYKFYIEFRLKSVNYTPEYILLSTINIMIISFASIFILDQMIFYNFFGARGIFLYIYFVIDNIKMVFTSYSINLI